MASLALSRWENNYVTTLPPLYAHRCGQDRGRDERAQETADGAKNPPEYKRLGRNPAAKWGVLQAKTGGEAATLRPGHLPAALVGVPLRVSDASPQKTQRLASKQRETRHCNLRDASQPPV